MRRLLPPLLLLVFIMPAVAQDLGLVAPTLLYNDNPALDTELISDVIVRELERQLTTEGIDYELLSAEGADTAAPTLLVPEFGIAEERLYLSATVRNRITNAAVSGSAVQSAVDVGLFNQVSRLYRSIAPALDREITEARQPVAPEGDEAGPELVAGIRFVSSQDHVEVRRAGGELLGVTENGQIEVDYLVLGSSGELPLVLERSGFYPEELTVGIDPEGGPRTIELPALQQATQVATYFAWSPQQALGLGLGGRYYLQNDLSFLQLEGFFHLQNDFESEANDGSAHVETRISGGRYFLFDYRSWFRFALEGALGFIYSSFPGRDVDPYWDPYITPLALILEANGETVSVFTRLETRFALGGSRAFFEPGVIEIPGQDVPIIATIGILSKW